MTTDQWLALIFIIALTVFTFVMTCVFVAINRIERKLQSLLPKNVKE